MLPEFYEVKAEFAKILFEYLNSKRQTYTPGYTEFFHKIFREGDKSGITRQEGVFEENKMQNLNSRFSLTNEDIESGDIGLIFALFDGVAKEIASGMEKMFVNTVEDATEKTGNIVKGKISPEMILELYKNMHINFDSHGKPIWPSIFYSPDTEEGLKNAMEALMSLPTYQIKLNELLESKKQEWFDRENNRKLVD